MIDVIELHKIYKDGNHALKGINCSVNKGDFLAVVGLSGSGKSTLMRCLNRLIEPTSGKIIFQKTDICTLSNSDMQRVRLKIGMVFQQFNLIRRCTVLTNVLTGSLSTQGILTPALGMWPERLKQKAFDKLDVLGIKEKALCRTDSLSGGQQQRVAIARALMQDPELILADEPVASLDPTNSIGVMEYLYKINKECGITMICSLHSLDIVDKYASRVIAIKDGAVVFEGVPSDFRSINKANIF